MLLLLFKLRFKQMIVITFVTLGQEIMKVEQGFR